MHRSSIFALAASTLAVALTSPPAAAYRGGVNRSVNGRTQTSVHQANVNSNRNVNVNVNRDVDVHGYGGYRYDSWGHPIATAAAVTATAVAVGTMVATLPTSGCSTVMAAGVAYQHCGSAYYQPTYQGSSVQYVVVNPPH